MTHYFHITFYLVRVLSAALKVHPKVHSREQLDCVRPYGPGARAQSDARTTRRVPSFGALVHRKQLGVVEYIRSRVYGRTRSLKALTRTCVSPSILQSLLLGRLSVGGVRRSFRADAQLAVNLEPVKVKCRSLSRLLYLMLYTQ